MQHCGTQSLETKRLILRPFVMEDAPFMFNNWASNPEVAKFLTWTHHTELRESIEVLMDWTFNYANKNFYTWAIVLKELGEPIGSIAVNYIDENIKSVEIGYCIGQNWWYQGIAAEALQEVIKFFFTKTDVNRIEALHDPENPNSGKVMQKCGMTYEGTLRDGDYGNLGIRDTCLYSILKREYKV